MRFGIVINIAIKAIVSIALVRRIIRWWVVLFGNVMYTIEILEGELSSVQTDRC